MVLAIATEEISLDLEVDKALSEGQFTRHFGINIDQLSKPFLTFDAYLAPTHHSTSYRQIRFVTLERKITCLSANALRHLAGVAEMRWLLEVSRDQWQSEAQAAFASEVPDAIWHCAQGDIAIEYDAGSYSPTKITSKIFAFKHYYDQIWGSPSQRRVEHLKTFLQQAERYTLPILAQWS